MSDLTDSVTKIITRYLSAVTLESFTFEKKEYQPKNLKVSPGIFIRKMTCVANCGACCLRFTNDWLPHEIDGIPVDYREEFIRERKITLNGEEFSIWSDTQKDHTDYYCRNLRKEDGRCGIHDFHPFSCDFELLRFFHHEDPNQPDRLAHQPFGRGWNMKRIDGDRGALCEWYESPCDEEWKNELIRKMTRLKEWTDHFNLNTTIPTIIEWMRRGPHERPLIVGPDKKEGFF